MRGDIESARRLAEDTLEHVENLSPAGFYLIHGCVTPGEVLLTLWERETSLEERAALAQNARRAVRAVQRYARIFPIGRPHALRLEGRCEALSGHPARAERAFAQSLAEATRLAMPVEQGLAHFEMGRHLPTGDPARTAHLEQARALFERTGRRYMAERAERLLAAAAAAPG
jgi:hypothetical protein